MFLTFVPLVIQWRDNVALLTDKNSKNAHKNKKRNENYCKTSQHGCAGGDCHQESDEK